MWNELDLLPVFGIDGPAENKSEKLKTAFWWVKRGAEVEVRNSWFRQCFGNSDLERLCFAAHIPPTMSVISHVLSITAPLSYTFTANRPPVLITKKKEKKKENPSSAVKKWTNAPCHTSDPWVKECKWKNDCLPRYPIICTVSLPMSALTCVRNSSSNCSFHLLAHLRCLIWINPPLSIFRFVLFCGKKTSWCSRHNWT